jgi:hypothetical protein
MTLEKVGQSEKPHGQEGNPDIIIDRPVIVGQLRDMEKNKVNPSAPQAERCGLPSIQNLGELGRAALAKGLRVDPERRILLFSKRWGLEAVERVKFSHPGNCKMLTRNISTSSQKKWQGAKRLSTAPFPSP